MPELAGRVELRIGHALGDRVANKHLLSTRPLLRSHFGHVRRDFRIDLFKRREWAVALLGDLCLPPPKSLHVTRKPERSDRARTAKELGNGIDLAGRRSGATGNRLVHVRLADVGAAGECRVARDFGEVLHYRPGPKLLDRLPDDVADARELVQDRQRRDRTERRVLAK